MKKLIKKVTACLKTVRSLENGLSRLEDFDQEMGRLLAVRFQKQF